MTATVRTPRPLLHPKQPLSRRLRVARDLGIGVAAADKLLYGPHALNIRYADVIESDLRAGDHEAVAQWVAPADAAMMGDDVPHIMEAWADYDEADVTEEACQGPLARKHLDEMTDDELVDYARAVAKELYKGTRFLCALHAEQKRRRMAK